MRLRPVVAEGRIEQSDAGLVAATDGWFVVNVRDAARVTGEYFADACVFEGDAAPFAQIGYTLAALQPGGRARSTTARPMEDFLVLAGECLLLVEGEERPLKAWDFVSARLGPSTSSSGRDDGPCVGSERSSPGSPQDRGSKSRSSDIH